MEKQQGRKLSLLAVTALLAVLVLMFSWMVVDAQEGEPGFAPAPATDSVEFNAQLQAEGKAPEVTTRWARTTVDTSILQTGDAGDQGVITTPEGVKTDRWSDVGVEVTGGEASYSSNACVHGGEVGSGGSCWRTGDVAGASNTQGDYSFLVNFSLLNLGLDAPSVNGSTLDSIVTSTRCYLDGNNVPQLVAESPTGTVSYGTGNTLGLITNQGTFDISGIANGDTKAVEHRMGSLLLGYSFAHAAATPRWGISTDGLSAYSEVEVSFRGETRALLGLLPFDSGWRSVTFRSECGFTMSGSEQMGPMQAPLQSPLRALQLPPDNAPTSAPGTPQTSGFTTEGTLDREDMSYHLLANRELDALDRLVIEEVLDEINVTGEVEGSNWKLFSAEAVGEQIPVIEVELTDGAIVQVRPIVEGGELPNPDLPVTPSTTKTTSAAPTSSTRRTSSPAPAPVTHSTSGTTSSRATAGEPTSSVVEPAPLATGDSYE